MGSSPRKSAKNLLGLDEFGALLSEIKSDSSNQIRSGNSEFGREHWKQLLKSPIYGRICLTEGSNRQDIPVKLSSAPGRKTAFVFGPDTVCGALLTKKPYELLLHLGFLPEYIHLKACIQKAKYWIVLLSGALNTWQRPIVPATWEGMEELIHTCYPAALEAVLSHWQTIKDNPVASFEEEVDYKFIAAVSDPSGPLYMGYDRFVSLPKPQTAWQTRLFLYCELRMFELFSGDGLTSREDGTKGEKEYVCMNYELEKIDRKLWLAIPLDVEVPEEVKMKYADNSYK
ncbi:uncharacterized protein LOC110974774 [Acanthaster planci]|uniref:Uncharacterized protein LOC110974774 n=1 Tax=Acanthaster planci TaxID=133434 RepID=A0A8B7XQ76_ACAPL|nr:uncharacterized protein LOC110974774 [Acanthaster planci]